MQRLSIRSTFFLLFIKFITFAALAQETHPVSWQFRKEKIGPGTFRISFLATINEPYHIYPQQSSGGGLGMPTTILFKENDNIEFVGEMEEKGLEQTEDNTVSYYAKGVTFTQTLKLRSDKETMLDFRIKYMACTDERCLPPSSKQFTLLLNSKHSGTDRIEEKTVNEATGTQYLTLQYEDFEMPDTEGKNVLSKAITSKSKYTFIDFWASWCGPCRIQARALVPMYHKYSPKGFRVIGVSLDTDASAWKKAISADGYSWINLSDLKGFESPLCKKYGIRAIPRNFLINAQGVIVAMDLHGKELEAKLEELFN